MSNPDRRTIDLERIADATGGDETFLRELVDIFIEDTDLRMQELREALEDGNSTDFGRTAHRLKGSSANIGAETMSHIAKRLEEMGRADALSDAIEAVKGLETEFGRVRIKLTDLVWSSSAQPLLIDRA